jgi:malate dehydrogenase (oxaloacetate-decarboxylating)(NADP+)
MNTPNRAAAQATDTDHPHGMALLRDPLLNKGTAFTEQERDALGLRGLLPAHVLSMEAHAKRVMTNLRKLPNDLEKYVAERAARPQRGAVLPRRMRQHR